MVCVFRSNDSTGYRENFLDLLASKNVTPEMFEDVPAGRYATAPAALTARFEACSDVSPMKYEVAAGSPLFLGSGSNATLEAQGMNLLSCMPSYDADGHHQRKESSNHHQQEHGNPMASFLQQISTRTSAGVHASLDYSGLGGLDKICQEGRAMEAASSLNIRSLPDFSSFGGYRSTKETTSVPPPPYMRCADRSDSSRQEQEIVPVSCMNMHPCHLMTMVDDTQLVAAVQKQARICDLLCECELWHVVVAGKE
jgi:hypothetical protein